MFMEMVSRFNVKFAMEDCIKEEIDEAKVVF